MIIFIKKCVYTEENDETSIQKGKKYIKWKIKTL